jgi:hypothetical protein
MSTANNAAESLRALCHELYEPRAPQDVGRDVSDLADCIRYIQQASRQLAEQLHRARLANEIKIDDMSSSFPDPVGEAIARLMDSNGRAADLYTLLDRAGQAASHLYSKDDDE